MDRYTHTMFRRNEIQNDRILKVVPATIFMARLYWRRQRPLFSTCSPRADNRISTGFRIRDNAHPFTAKRLFCHTQCV